MGSAKLLDRVPERAALAGLLDAARAGRSGVLVIRGEPGIGKTALLEYAIESSAGLRVTRVAGIESEMELAFSALHQLCTPMLSLVDRLPGPQHDALEMAFGLRAGTAPDRFLVSLAALGLVATAAADQPLLWVVDDTQWLDRASAQVLGFVARRLLAEPAALVLATREPGEELTGLPELVVLGLDDGDARDLLSSMFHAPLDERVRERLIAETRGNPLALLELPRGLMSAEQYALSETPDVVGLSERIEESFQRRLELLPAATRLLLLAAAAEPTGDPVLLWRAADRLGIAPEAESAAETAGLVTVSNRVTFRHPLVRSATYRSASPDARRAVHRALADVTDPETDQDRRAWHRAQAAEGPDEDIAEDLERSAGRAHARGGCAAAASFLQRSAALTLDPLRRADRSLAAATAKYQAGAFDAALGLVAAAGSGRLDDFQRARLDLLHARIAFAANRGRVAPPLLLDAARQFERLDAALARETYMEALSAALFASRLAGGAGLQEIAAAALAVPAPQPARPADLLLDGLALVITQGYPAADPVLKAAVQAFRRADGSDEELMACLWQACGAAGLRWDYESWDVLSARLVTLVRQNGALMALPIAFSTRAGVHLFAGDFAAAASFVAEVQSVTQATRSSIAPYAELTLAVMQGHTDEAFRLIEAGMTDVEHRGEGEGQSFLQWATALLCNSLGRYEQALEAAQQASEDSPAIWFSNWALAELTEAASRSGLPERAEGALHRLAEIGRACGTDWVLGICARSRALVSDGAEAEASYREAIERLDRTPLRVELGRAHLVYGEWLRRERRRRDARDQLHEAYSMFDSIGAACFAGRARAELRATGEHVRKRAADIRAPLTAQEALIARLAGEGASNPQIAEQLYISPATVAYHLRKVFAKLDVSSRHQLATAASPKR